MTSHLLGRFPSTIPGGLSEGAAISCSSSSISNESAALSSLAPSILPSSPALQDDHDKTTNDMRTKANLACLTQLKMNGSVSDTSFMCYKESSPRQQKSRVLKIPKPRCHCLAQTVAAAGLFSARGLNAARAGRGDPRLARGLGLNRPNVRTTCWASLNAIELCAVAYSQYNR